MKYRIIGSIVVVIVVMILVVVFSGGNKTNGETEIENVEYQEVQ